MQLIFTPFIWRMMERRQRALGSALMASDLAPTRVLRRSAGAPTRMANALRTLAMDAVQQANSGHPGAPMGMAEMAVALWTGHLRTTRPTRTGPTATASCSPTAMPRCCSTRCCT